MIPRGFGSIAEREWEEKMAFLNKETDFKTTLHRHAEHWDRASA